MPESASKLVLAKKIDVFLNVSDVYQFAKNRVVRELRVEDEPYYTTYSAGIKAFF
jgi:hypothetical protein